MEKSVVITDLFPCGAAANCSPSFNRTADGLRKLELGADRYVFGNEVGDLVGRRRLCGLWLETCERAKVKNLHLHDLRREHATQLSEAGVPVDVIRDQLGHSNITMTNTYLGRSRDRLAQAAKQRTAMRAREAMRLARVGLSGKQARSS